MTEHERIAIACIIGVGAIVLCGLLVIRSFGCYALKMFVEESRLTRQSQEATRQSNWHTIDEVRANTAEVKLARELFEARTNHSRSA